MSSALFDDLDASVDAAVTTLRSVVDKDWQLPAVGLRWTCWETLEHVSDDLLSYAGQIVAPDTGTDDYVPLVFEAFRAGGPELVIRSQPYRGNPGLLEVLETCAALLSTIVRAVPPERRGWHPYGVADAGGFAAMGTVETIVHLYDVAEPLQITWQPPDDVVRRALDRLFPDAPRDTDPWRTMLWATGRGELPGRKALDGWRWDSTVRDEP